MARSHGDALKPHDQLSSRESRISKIYRRSTEHRVPFYASASGLSCSLFIHDPRVTLVVDLEITASAAVTQIYKETGHKAVEVVLVSPAGRERALLTRSAELQNRPPTADPWKIDTLKWTMDGSRYATTREWMFSDAMTRILYPQPAGSQPVSRPCTAAECMPTAPASGSAHNTVWVFLGTSILQGLPWAKDVPRAFRVADPGGTVRSSK